jgi:hypothetical protein
MKYNVFTPKSTYRVNVMLFYATFNNISVKSWLSVIFVEETKVSRENHRPAAYLLIWLGLLRLTPLSTTFQLYTQMYCDGQLYWWRKPEYPGKTTDLPHIYPWNHNLRQQV